MTFTKEWLQKAISDIETMRDEIPFGLDEDGNNTLSALKLALAGMESEPVACIDQANLDYLKSGSDADVWPVSSSDADSVLLYSAPQPLTTSERAELENYRNAQQVVHVDADDNFYSWFGREWHEHYQHNQYTTAAKQMLGVMAESAWNACRAAKLQAEPVSQPYTLPPLDHLDTVKFNADCAIQDPDSIYANEFFLSLDEVFGERGNYSEPVQAKAVSMLIAEVFRLRGYSRAAPQQEVKSAFEHGMQRYAGAMQKLSEGDK